MGYTKDRARVVLNQAVEQLRADVVAGG